MAEAQEDIMLVLGDDQIVSYRDDDAYVEKFPEEFKKYIGDELSWLRCPYGWGVLRWIFWSRDDDKLERSPDSPYCNLEFKKKIRHALQLIKFPYYALLIQYWAPITIDDRCLITTRKQPFLLSEIHEGLCGYRMISEAYNFYADGKSEEELGLPGRVFVNKLPESTPNVKYYSSKEYPQRDDALRHGVVASFAWPVFDTFGQSCVGVLELVTGTRVTGYSPISSELYYFVPAFEDAGLNCSDVHRHSHMLQSNKNEAFTAAKNEIEKVLELVCEACELRFAQTWIPCSLCNTVVNGIPGVSYNKVLMSTIANISYMAGLVYENFMYACDDSHLLMGQGVVGKALLSRNMLFCTDVTQFSISEYPLAHHARECGLRGCFAICLQSSRTGNDVYVLEFFLDVSNRSHGELQTLLHNVLRTMKQSFKTFKLASREELGEELPINVIDFHNGEKRLSQIPPTIRSPPRPTEAFQNRPAASAEQISNIAVACPQEQSRLRPKSTTGIQISLEDLLQHAGKKINDAAKSLKVSRSTFKRICRENNILRWPPRNIKKDHRSLPVEESVIRGVAQEQILQSSSGPVPKQAVEPKVAESLLRPVTKAKEKSLGSGKPVLRPGQTILVRRGEEASSSAKRSAAEGSRDEGERGCDEDEAEGMSPKAGEKDVLIEPGEAAAASATNERSGAQVLRGPGGLVKVLGGVQEIILDPSALFAGVKAEYVLRLRKVFQEAPETFTRHGEWGPVLAVSVMEVLGRFLEKLDGQLLSSWAEDERGRISQDLDNLQSLRFDMSWLKRRVQHVEEMVGAVQQVTVLGSELKGVEQEIEALEAKLKEQEARLEELHERRKELIGKEDGLRCQRGLPKGVLGSTSMFQAL